MKLKHLLEHLKSNVPEFHTLESPQQQAPNIQIASTTCPAVTVPEQTVSEQIVPEQNLSVHIESPQLQKRSVNLIL